MNKKFSTLLAGVALLGAMSANAGNPVTSLQKTGNGLGSPDKPGGLSIQLCKSEKKEFYIRYSS